MSRFCQLLNYKGFADMKFCAEKELLFPNETVEFNDDDNIRITKKKYLNLYTTVLTDTLLNIKDQYILIAAKALTRAEHVYIYSSGRDVYKRQLHMSCFHFSCFHSSPFFNI